MIASKLTNRCLILRRGLATRISTIQSLSIQRSTSYYAPRNTYYVRSSPAACPPAIPIRRYAAKYSTTIVVGDATTSAAAAASSSPSGEGGGTAGKVFFSSLCLLTFGLGVWQTRRYFEKITMVQKRDDDLNLDPLPTFDDWQMLLKQNKDATNTATKQEDGKITSKDKSYRRVYLRGKFQHENEILIGPRGPPPGALAETGPNSGRGGGGGMSSSAQGYWVVTPFAIVNEEEKVTVSTGQVEGVQPKRGEEGGTFFNVGGWFGRLWARSKPSTESASETKSAKQPSHTNKEEQTIVWVNRGWIPRHYINNKTNEIITSWEQPNDIVQLMTMESTTETPGMYSPPSRLDANTDQKPSLNKLLWMDRNAMEEIMMTTNQDDAHPPLFVEINTDEAAPSQQHLFPVKPSREFVGEFKVTSEIHAGYAVTWFGLSGAGMVMTRKLLTRGR